MRYTASKGALPFIMCSCLYANNWKEYEHLFINIAVAENTICMFVLLVVFKICLDVKQYVHCHFTVDRGKLALFLQMYQLDIPKLDL